MTVAEYIAEFISSKGTTDVFGLPGGGVLDLLYAFNENPNITPHLMYHEQCAGFAACGYAQNSGKLGVAYATRGPGFTNLISAIADAYCDSIPTLFITGHTTSELHPKMRVMDDQELDTCSIVETITKYAKRVDSLEDVQTCLEEAYLEATTGRKAPVLLDINSDLFRKEIELSEASEVKSDKENLQSLVSEISTEIRTAKRPVFLIGDGINQVHKSNSFRQLVVKANIPVISSRFSHDIMGDANLYYGYVGSHGMRAANFIFSKADTVITIGNRLHFPPNSASYKPVIEQKKFIRIEIDENEFERVLPNAINHKADISTLIDALSASTDNFGKHGDWIKVCEELKQRLSETDVTSNVKTIASFLKSVPDDYTVACDVGNNEFFVSRASTYAGSNLRTQYSKSFGILGCGLGKAIGAYYSTHKSVICFVGDQGLQLNIQELQYITQHNLPIIVVVLNNHSSGMIKDRETLRFKSHYLHTTNDSEYTHPDFSKIALAYNIEYVRIEPNLNGRLNNINKPILMEIEIDDNEMLSPNLPKGEPLRNLSPFLSSDEYEYLNNL